MEHTTNYLNTFLEIAEDSKNITGEIPPEKDLKTIAKIEYDLLMNNPYTFTSDEVLFRVYVIRNKISKDREIEERKVFFSRSQACLRSSPLAKTYGWGIHFNNEGKVAIYSANSKEYNMYKNDDQLKHIKAMRNTRK